MRIRTRITQMARARGLTAAEVARRLRLYRSNVSAMDAGRRSVSLRTLNRVAEVLACQPGELLETSPDSTPLLFRHPASTVALEARAKQLVDGAERAWVHTAMLAWQRHYRQRHRK